MPHGTVWFRTFGTGAAVPAAKLLVMDDRSVSRKDLTEMEEHLFKRIGERVEQTETKLLAAFHGWARSMEIRVRGVGAVAMGFDERLALAEDRISELERRKA